MDAPGAQTAHHYRAQPTAVGAARRAAVAFARSHDVPDRRLDDIALAVSEATANVIVHAYRDRADPGTFMLGLDVEDGSLLIDVRDDGIGPSPRDDSPGLGLGLPIIARLTDAHAIVATDGGGTWLSMRFDLDH
jgi:serine/threonine-protein kinase RsbW